MPLKRFIKQILTISIGFLISLLFLCLIVFFVFSKLSPTNATEIKENSVVSLDIKGEVVEWMPVSLLGSNKGMVNFKVVAKAIDQAREDGRIAAIYLDLSYLNAGWAVLEELRNALLAFKEQGKTVIAYADYYTQKSYYLASVADEIILNPSGVLEFKGLSATIQFYTRFFENISVKPIIFRIGDYKSAVEPFCFTKMSDESKKQTKAYLDPLYDHFLTNIGKARSITLKTLKQHAINLSGILPKDALHAGLITKVSYATDAKKLLKEKTKSLDFVSYKVYAASEDSSDLSDKIAILVAEGQIIEGSSRLGYVGGNDFAKTLKTIQEDSRIKGVVLRINSPGGSVMASDIMWHAIEELKTVKPVVASLSSVAASGGYYVAAPCNYIFAQPTTITGSIGIFAMLFDPTNLMHKIGINSDVVKTAPSADFLSPRVSCSEQESTFMRKMLQGGYDDFLHKVSTGRGLSLAVTEKLAGGRIYTGSVAQTNGLVDELGGLKEAIAKAADLAKLTKGYSIAYFPRPETKLEQLLSYTTDNMKMELLDELVQAYPILSNYQALSRPYGLQAMLPYTIHIE